MATFAIYIEDLTDGGCEVHACHEKGRLHADSEAEQAMRVGVQAIKQWMKDNRRQIEPREGTVIQLQALRRRKKGKRHV